MFQDFVSIFMGITELVRLCFFYYRLFKNNVKKKTSNKNNFFHYVFLFSFFTSFNLKLIFFSPKTNNLQEKES